MELTQLIRLFIRWLWLIVAMALLAGAVGYALSRRAVPAYKATTTLLVTDGRPNPNGTSAIGLDVADRLTTTYKEVLLKRPVLEGVIARLGLATDADGLAGKLSVSAVRDTQLLALTAEDSDPQQAAAIANMLVEVFQQKEPELLANPYVANRSWLHVVEAAQPPQNPAGAGPLRTILIATLVGAMLAVGVAFALEYFDTTIRSGAEAEQLTGFPVLAAIRRIKGGRPSDKLVTLKAPLSSVAEAYRMIHAHLEFNASTRSIHTLIVTSSKALEGKSTAAANLAVALADAGRRVILVDANLRTPTLHRIFDHAEETRGLTAALRDLDAGRAYDYTIPTRVEKLRLLLSGPLPPNTAPARLLVPNRMSKLIEQLKPHADLVIFDSPAAPDVAETSLLARSCDAALLVVLARHTPADVLLQTRALLARSRAFVLGIVLNQAPRSERGSGVSYLDGPARGEFAAPQQWPELSVHAERGSSVTTYAVNGNGDATNIIIPSRER